MPNTLMKQWVEMGQASLDALKQMSESSTSGFDNVLQQQFKTADAATMLKALLDSNKQLGDMTTAVFNGMFHNQMKLVNLSDSSAALQELTSTNTTFVNAFVQKQMGMVNDFTTLFTTYLADLQNTRDLNDVTLLQGDFFNTMEQKLKDSANELSQLLLSAKTAATAWTGRTLDKAIEADQAGAGTGSGTPS